MTDEVLEKILQENQEILEYGLMKKVKSLINEYEKKYGEEPTICILNKNFEKNMTIAKNGSITHFFSIPVFYSFAVDEIIIL